jgi:hypothetical protein
MMDEVFAKIPCETQCDRGVLMLDVSGQKQIPILKCT